jgi:mono/diheme cytochrome c family protein
MVRRASNINGYGRRYLLVAPVLVLLPSPTSAQPPPALAREAKAVLQTHCVACHGGGKAAKGGFGFVLDRGRLVSRLLLSPGQSSRSDLFLRVEQGEMPPPSRKLRPSPKEVATLKRWIDAGAPPFDSAADGAGALSPLEATTAIAKDLEAIDVRSRRFTRYLTLNHLAYAGRPASELDSTREAAAKLLSSLSWHPRLSRPEPVDAAATILRLDLRAYKWTAALWEKLATAFPYRLQTATDAHALAGLAGTEFPALRADWFVATASRPPFYHDLLQLPGTDRALERSLQVDVAGDIEDDNLMRAGFNDSGVSRNNRLIERHDAVFGSFWRSYDFSANSGRQNLFEHPLGPNAGATSFRPTGGEIIFHLPNGLLAYMLVDGQGKRIDKAPVEIVADPRRPDQRVQTGISCMSCHARGFLFKADQVRGHVEKNVPIFGVEVVNAVRQTHPRPARLQAQIDEDNRRYLKALEPFGVRDPDQEPINLVTQRFEATLDARTAAAELGLKVEELGPLLHQAPEQARILGSLLQEGGTAQRAVFEEHFPELARRVSASRAVAITKAVLPGSFQGHTATVNCVVFSSDGRKVASGGDDQTVRIWEVGHGVVGRIANPSYGKQLACLEGLRGEVYAVAFGGEDKRLLTAGSDRLVRLWDLGTNKVVRAFAGHTGSIRSIVMSPYGKHCASAGDDRSVRVWDLESGEEVAALTGHADAVTALAWSTDGQHILSASRDGTLRWWDSAQAKPLARLEGHIGPVLSVALAPDGLTALSGGNDKTIRLWGLAQGNELHCFKGHANAVIQVQFDTSGREFFSSSSQHQGSDQCWRRWDLASRKEIGARGPGSEQRFGCAAFAPDGKQVIVGGPGGFLRLWSW